MSSHTGLVYRIEMVLHETKLLTCVFINAMQKVRALLTAQSWVQTINVLVSFYVGKEQLPKQLSGISSKIYLSSNDGHSRCWNKLDFVCRCYCLSPALLCTKCIEHSHLCLECIFMLFCVRTVLAVWWACFVEFAAQSISFHLANSYVCNLSGLAAKTVKY